MGHWAPAPRVYSSRDAARRVQGGAMDRATVGLLIVIVLLAAALVLLLLAPGDHTPGDEASIPDAPAILHGDEGAARRAGADETAPGSGDG